MIHLGKYVHERKFFFTSLKSLVASRRLETSIFLPMLSEEFKIGLYDTITAIFLNDIVL
jgi:hypothetical protein